MLDVFSIVDAAWHVRAVHTRTQREQATIHKEGSGANKGLWWI